MKRIGTVATAGALLGLIMPSATLAQIAMPTLPVAPKKEVSPVLAGDDKLTCPQILAETQARQKEFDAALDEADNAKVGMSARTAGLLAAHEALASTVPLIMPDVNPGAMAAVGASTQAYMESARADTRKVMEPIEQRADFARVRSDYLNDLYRNKCFKKGATGPAPTKAMLAPDGNAPVAPVTATPATPPAPTSPVSAKAPATAANTGGALADLPADKMECPTLLAESQRLRKLLDGDVAAMISAAQNYKPVGQTAGGAAQAVTSIASAFVPGAAMALDAINSGRQIAQQAAQKAQMAAFQNKMQNQAQGQMALGSRITELEVAYEERCQ